MILASILFYTQRDYNGFSSLVIDCTTNCIDIGNYFDHLPHTSTISLLALADRRMSSENRMSNKDTPRRGSGRLHHGIVLLFGLARKRKFRMQNARKTAILVNGGPLLGRPLLDPPGPPLDDVPFCRWAREGVVAAQKGKERRGEEGSGAEGS